MSYRQRQDEMTPMGAGRFWGFWYLMGRFLGGQQVRETVPHNALTQIWIPIGRALLGGVGLCMAIIAYIGVSYLWAWNVAASDLGRALLPVLVFGLPAILAALLGIGRAVEGAYWGSRQSMYLIYGISSGALCYVFVDIAVADPNGDLFWELVKTSSLIGLASFGFLCAVWGIWEQLVTYQMTEAQRAGMRALMPRLGRALDAEENGEGPGIAEIVVREWVITFHIVGGHTKIFHFDPEKLSESKFAWWAETIIAMGRLREDVSYKYWVAGGRFTRGEYDHLTDVLIDQKALAKQGRAKNSPLILTPDGRRLIRAWLSAYTDYEMTAPEIEADEVEEHRGNFQHDDEGQEVRGSYELRERQIE